MLTKKSSMNVGSKMSSSMSLKLEQLGLDNVASPAVKAYIQSKVAKERHKLEGAMKTKEANTKRAACNTSIEFIKNQTVQYQKLLTKEHQHFIKEFLDFKKKTWAEIS